MGQMSVLVGGGTAAWLKEVFPPEVKITAGDTRVMWDRRSPDEVATARSVFEKLRAKNYNAFRVEGKEGTRGEQITTFDPEAERLIMIPPMKGGANDRPTKPYCFDPKCSDPYCSRGCKAKKGGAL